MSRTGTWWPIVALAAAVAVVNTAADVIVHVRRWLDGGTS